MLSTSELFLRKLLLVSPSLMLSYQAVSHFDFPASVVTRTLSEAECSKNRWLKIALSGVKNQ